MSFSDVLLLRKFTHSVISITAAMVALLGGWILISAFSNGPETQLQLPAAIRAPSVARQPNAIAPPSFAPKVNEVLTDIKVETFNLECLNDMARDIALKSAAKQVRIKAQFCSKKLTSAPESSIVNRTNGYVATLFNIEQGGLTSDYITLAEGQNQILLQLQDIDGRRVTAEVTILRQ